MFLSRRKSGTSKTEARCFDDNFYTEDKHLKSWNPVDVSETLQELKKLKLVMVDILGNITITDEGIVYMEGRFKGTLENVLEYISKIF